MRCGEEKKRSVSGGSTEVLISLAILMALGSISLTMSYFSTAHSRREIKKINAREGFYSSELVAWHDYERVKAGLSPTGVADAQGRYPASVDNQYDSNLPASLPSGQYNPTSYSAGTPINVKDTRSLDSSNTIIRRFDGENVRYSEPAGAGGTSYCGQMAFAEGQNQSWYGTCLAHKFKCPPGICAGFVQCQASTEAKPISLIKSQADLQAITSGGNYRLDNDIALTGTMTPIGGSNLSTPLTDIIFDGQGHTISGLTIASTEISTCPGWGPQIGLFGLIRDSVIMNLKLTGVNVTHTGSGASVGGLVGQMFENSCVENSSVVGVAVSHVSTVCGGGTAGGLVSAMMSGFEPNKNVVVANCWTNIAVSSDEGGVGSDSLAGGLIGAVGGAQTGIPSSRGKIINSYALGSVTAAGRAAHVGGLIGWITRGDIDHSYSSGAVTATSSSILAEAGGLIGSFAPNTNDTVTVTQSFATGNVTSSGPGVAVAAGFAAGIGFFGIPSNISISDCRAVGKVAATSTDTTHIHSSRAAGFIWSVDLYGTSQVTNSYHAGQITSNCPNLPRAMGFIGDPGGSTPSNLTVTSSYWDTQASGVSTSSRGTPKTTVQMRTQQSTYVGWDFSSVWKMLPGKYPKLRWEP